ncbi:MAG TPA: hypothetical protein VKQ30_11815, partial [Ktedonobacterales bacterium]|nr:hypothetical protein [Ktedonobacterales bacterium]
ASYYVVPILLRVGDLGSTRATQYLDEYSGAIFEKNGWLLWGLALVGAAMMYLGLARYRRESPVLRARFATGGISGAARGFVICASATLLLAFLFGYYVYRQYSFRFSSSHQPYTLFTPTRFLTDLTYFLPFFAALPLATAWQWTVSHIPRFAVPPATASLLSRVLVRMLITCVVLGTTVFLLDIPAMQTHGRLAPGEAAAFAWIRANTPASTLVINLNTNANWTPYFTQREVSYTPVPVSEFVDGYVNEKRFLSDRVLDAMTQPGSSRVIAFAGIGTAITSLASRPVAIVTDHTLLNLSVAPAFVADPQRVYLLGDAFTSLNINHPSTGTAALAWWSASSSPADDWTTSIPSPDGWTSVPPLASTARAAMYLRLVLLGSSASGLRIRCEAHGSVAIYEDGVQIPHGCVGGWKALPSFVTSGPHVLAFRVGFDSAADPWFAVMLMKPADASCGC